MNCAICNKSSDLFSLRFEDGEVEEPYTSHVCGKCWEHISAIATRAMRAEMVLLNQRIEKLEQSAQQGVPRDRGVMMVILCKKEKIEIPVQLFNDLIEASDWVATFYNMFINGETAKNCYDRNAVDYLASEAKCINTRARDMLAAQQGVPRDQATSDVGY